ncbi:3-oxo-tetronate kinase [uncultured Cohaesibacter sp.]|uniref:3-oxo-tetronate kinase n=1 Tax=uncultured Cohaesibacter sp. TaxID=1002546 RepID=UPI00292F027B|nr:3-oxo-tetronate kinase [uncultured Cohaesibacter sp.]
MLIGVIADDFTGASDIANTLAKGLPNEGGLSVLQYLGVPDEPADPEVEAAVIALKTRTIAVEDAVKQSLAALDWLKAQGCRQILFKYCSTFDSTQDGNIGPVAEALAQALDVSGVVACPAFPTLGRSVYQGHLFVGDRLISESGMRNHPLTPMTDPDLRRWLSLQCKTPVGLVDAGTIHLGSEAVREALSMASQRGETLVITDTVTDDDLLTLGKALDGTRMITGGSGIALGLPHNFIRQGLATGKRPPTAGQDGPGIILAGSCSGATRGQIDYHTRRYPSLRVTAKDAMREVITPESLVEFFSENLSKSPLVYSSDTPEEVTRAQKEYGRERVSAQLESLFAQAAALAAEKGFNRIVVAGGETSSAVALRLKTGPLRIGAEIDPGVPILLGRDRPIALALKSGNFGTVDFFEKALEALSNKGEPSSEQL